MCPSSTQWRKAYQLVTERCFPSRLLLIQPAESRHRHIIKIQSHAQTATLELLLYRELKNHQQTLTGKVIYRNWARCKLPFKSHSYQLEGWEAEQNGPKSEELRSTVVSHWTDWWGCGSLHICQGQFDTIDFIQVSTLTSRFGCIPWEDSLLLSIQRLRLSGSSVMASEVRTNAQSSALLSCFLCRMLTVKEDPPSQKWQKAQYISQWWRPRCFLSMNNPKISSMPKGRLAELRVCVCGGSS